MKQTEIRTAQSTTNKLDSCIPQQKLQGTECLKGKLLEIDIEEGDEKLEEGDENYRLHITKLPA